MKQTKIKILCGLMLTLLAPLANATSTATWVYQDQNNYSSFTDGLVSDSTASHTFNSNTAGYSMTLTGYRNDGAAAGTTTNLAVALSPNEWGVGLVPGPGDNEIRYYHYLEISNLTVPNGQTATGLQLVFNSVDPKEGGFVYGSTCETYGCQLTQLRSFNNSGTTNGLLVDLNADDLSKYKSFWITAKADGGISSVILGNGTNITSVATSTVPVPAAVWLFGTAFAGLMSYRKKKTVA